MRRRLPGRGGTVRAAALAAGLVLLAQPAAWAGSDVFGNVSPASQVPEGLSERYALGNYALDEHFNAVDASLTGGVDASGVPPMIAHFLANALWQLTAFLADALITLFTFAFSLNLVRGSEATGGAGALEPVGRAIRALYSDVLGQPWLVVAVAAVGIWAMWRALVQRRYTETAGALGLSLLYLVLALAFVTQPERTVGEASRWTNQMSVAFLSLSRGGDLSSEREAKRAASDQLFSLLVYEPWTVLQFGGREHCVRWGTGSDDEDPESVAVRPLARDPGRDAALAAELRRRTQVEAEGKTCLNNRNKYAPHFLRFAPGSDERNAEYEALNSGDASKLPDEDPSKERGDYPLGVADKPATDAIEKGGQYQRLLVALVVFVGELGAFLLLGALALGVILAQVLLLLLLAFAPVALVFGVVPGRGHDFFRGWLTRIAGFLLRKAAYSLILAVLLAVNAALAEATSNLGWLLSFGLQGLFFWSVFLYRHQLTGQLLTATAGAAAARQDGARQLANLYYGTQLAGRPWRGLRRQLRRPRRRTRSPGAAVATDASAVGPPPPAAVAGGRSGPEEGERGPADAPPDRRAGTAPDGGPASASGGARAGAEQGEHRAGAGAGESAAARPAADPGGERRRAEQAPDDPAAGRQRTEPSELLGGLRADRERLEGRPPAEPGEGGEPKRKRPERPPRREGGER
jgi:hypothetical protein